MKKYIQFVAFLSFLSIFPSVHAELPANWDSSRYISIREINPDMEAYCLTVLQGDKIEKFPLKILSIVKQARVAQDMILVISTDDRLKHLGAIHGCSGSPVYINNRLAGALAAGWDGSIDPLYMVTPIEYMLTIGQGEKKAASTYNKYSCVELAAPLNKAVMYQKTLQFFNTSPQLSSRLPVTTNLSTKACELLNESMATTGLVLMQADNAPQFNPAADSQSVFKPGGVLAIPLCSGDIRMAATGTVTEIIGDKVYGFGHPFTGISDIELPMASGTIYTVIATRLASIKLAGASEVAGTLRFDEETGVMGVIGQMPKQIDLTMNIKRFDAVKDQTLHCKIARDRRLTPLILRAAITGGTLYQGELPTEHAIHYQCTMRLQTGQQFCFSGVSSGQSVMDMTGDIFSLTGALLNNPFQPLYPDKIELNIDITPDNLTTLLWGAKLTETIVRPGETVAVNVALKGFRSELKSFTAELKIPANCPEGKYPLQICGVEAYQAFLLKAAPQRFTVIDAQSLLVGLERVLNIQSDRLYICLPMDQSGLTVRNAELPNLPTSKMLLLTDEKRIQPAAPYQNFIEVSIPTGLIVSGSTTIELTVDKNK